MFEKKKEQLYDLPVKETKGSTTTNQFINAGMKKSAETLSGNAAKKYSTTGNPFVDQFGNTGDYLQKRPFESISKDVSTLWALDAPLSVKFSLFLRLITRKTDVVLRGEKLPTQRGAGLKHESIMRFMWLAVNHPNVFYKNIPLFIAAGSWKDIITMMTYDLEYNGWEEKILDFSKMADYLLAGLENENSSELVKKYLPHVVARSKTKTIRSQARNMIAKYLAERWKLSGTSDKQKNYKAYRKMKSSGKAHEWQKAITRGNFTDIDFNDIHGRALAQIVSSKFIKDHGLEAKYLEWVESQPVAKFKGYIHELAQKITPNMRPYQKMTVNKQFEGLIKEAQDGAVTNTGMIVVVDTSGSMSSKVPGLTMSAKDLAFALANYFSAFLTGYFANSWIEFTNTATMHKWTQDNFVDRFRFDRGNGYVGSTNFQDVINLFVRIKNTGVPESEFPTGILCLSDGEFNRGSHLFMTNFEQALLKLKKAGFSDEYVSNFQVVLWDIRNTYYGINSSRKFETHGETTGIFYLSGFDGSQIAFLTGIEKKVDEQGNIVTPKTDVELFNAAMDQELLDMVQV